MTVADLETLGSGEAEAPPPVDDKGRKITGRSPSRIALDRLRKDKVAVVCATIVFILVLLGIFAPWICKRWASCPTSRPAGRHAQYLQFGLPEAESARRSTPSRGITRSGWRRTRRTTTSPAFSTACAPRSQSPLIATVAHAR